MAGLKQSKLAAWGALLLVVLLIVLTFSLRTVWWAFSDIFFAFMMVFCHLVAVYMARLNPYVSRTLDRAALVFGILFVAALIVEFILFQVAFS